MPAPSRPKPKAPESPNPAIETHRFQQVADLIEGNIKGLAAGEALPSTTAWRLKLGVSRTTITRAFALLKARGLLTAKAGVGSRVDSPSRTKLVLVLWEGALGERNHGALAGEFFTGAAMAAAKRGEFLVTHLPATKLGPGFRPRHEFPGLAGVIFFRCPELRRRHAPRLAEDGIPSVLYGSTSYADPVLDVAVDEHRIAELALDAFIDCGRKRIGFVYRQGHPAGETRRQAWLDWHFRKGLPIHPSRVLVLPPVREAGFQGLLKPWLKDLDAVWAATDTESVGIFDRCRDLDIRIPDDIALIGVDNSGYLENLGPGLSSVDIPLVDHAEKCLDALFAHTPGMLLRDMTLKRRGSLPSPGVSSHTKRGRKLPSKK